MLDLFCTYIYRLELALAAALGPSRVVTGESYCYTLQWSSSAVALREQWHVSGSELHLHNNGIVLSTV